MNILYFRVSYDIPFLIRVHKTVIKTDEFIRHLLDILETVSKEGVCQTNCLLIQRSDYMCQKSKNEDGYELKQVGS